jgi:hypothetical protein
MSAYSTLEISKEKAQCYVVEKLFSVPNSTLERIVDILLEERLYNCKIGESKDDIIL